MLSVRPDYVLSSLQIDELARFLHLSEDDQALIRSWRGDHNRLGFALQLTTVRFLGTFLEDSMEVPSEVVQTLSRQLGITNCDGIGEYRQGRWCREHAAEIRARFGYRDFGDPVAGFRLRAGLCPVLDRYRATQRALRSCHGVVAHAQGPPVRPRHSERHNRFSMRLRIRTIKRSSTLTPGRRGLNATAPARETRLPSGTVSKPSRRACCSAPASSAVSAGRGQSTRAKVHLLRVGRTRQRGYMDRQQQCQIFAAY